MKIVITSDWHIDALTDGVPRHEEVEALIDQSVQCAIEEEVGLYIMCGDLCNPDSWCAVRAMAKAVEVAGKLADRGVESIWVSGNHDVVEDGLGTTTLSPVRTSGLSFHTFEDPGEVAFEKGSTKLHIVGLPFTPGSHAYEPEKFVARCKAPRGYKTIVLGHLNLEGITSGSEMADMARGREVFWPLAMLKKKLPQAKLIAGHYHKAQTFKGIEVVGSLARLRHDEEDHNPSLMILNV